MLLWSNRQNPCFYYDSNHYAHDQHRQYELLFASGSKQTLSLHPGNTFAQLQQFHQQIHDWLFGYIAYDTKNEIENLHSQNTDRLGFDDLYFVQPQTVGFLQHNQLTIGSWDENPETIFRTIQKIRPKHFFTQKANAPQAILQQNMSREAYLEKVAAIIRHIRSGDVYELNLCIEFFYENFATNPLLLFHQLNTYSPAPFAAFVKTSPHYVLCASPERFLQKKNQQLISQPIKGTIARAKNVTDDNLQKEILQKNPKERAENIMIVDLVRNDLSKHALAGSIEVEELLACYTFAHVHQLISTIKAEISPNVPFSQVIKDAFPMGSMTGAPKISAMQLIEQYENSRRAVYSGALGYIDPQANFDFSVVIRSLLYNAERQYLSMHAGSAITFDSVATQEYEECLLKAHSSLQALFH
ncbi:MAG: anthranilate synthase component I family protein [Bacteroidetes bacterium]|nr:anthranilate synthase component I family protein [Bacteroidota bacterium]MCB9042707.1 anthranilate synthase component I family protein [Chitinophagales bacterium]